MKRKVSVFICGVLLIIFTLITCFPIDAIVLVPSQHGDHVCELLKDQHVLFVRDRTESFSGSHQRSLPGFGWQVWLSQSAIMSDAESEGYYCEITYFPVLSYFRWKRSVGDSRMIGLQ